MQESDSTIVHFSRRFDEACEKRGIKNAALAKAVGCTPTAIGNYRKDRIPKAEELSRIAAFLGVSMEWLLTGSSIRPTNLNLLTKDETDAVLQESMPELINWRQRAEQAESRAAQAERKLAEIKRVLSAP